MHRLITSLRVYVYYIKSVLEVDPPIWTRVNVRYNDAIETEEQLTHEAEYGNYMKIFPSVIQHSAKF